jgi:hypothetical protein
MNQKPQNAECIENFSGRVVTIVRCYYEGSTRDQHDTFALDEYTLLSRFQQPLLFNIAPVSELLGECTLEAFLQELPERYFAFQTFKMCYGQATIGREQIFLMSSPFAESSVLSYVGGTRYTASQVRSMFFTKRRSKVRDEILEATLRHETFIQTRAGNWRLFFEERNEHYPIPADKQE